MRDIETCRGQLYAARDNEDNKAIRPILISVARELPKTPEALELFRVGFELLDRIEDQASRRLALLEYTKEIPSTGVFSGLYLKAAEAAIIAADSLDESYRRIVELTRIAEEMPRGQEFVDLRVLAWRLALDLPDKPRFAASPIAKIARELPKSSDLSFFTRYTLLGIARMAPKDGPFAAVYRDAIELAMQAASVIEEPFYRRYASFSIGAELPKGPEFADLYLKALQDVCKYSLEMKDPFARELGLLELLGTIPRTREFFLLLQQVLEECLSFFTVRRWMDDVEVFDVVDYILSAEDHGITDSKKNRFLREKYSKLLALEVEKFGSEINDTRFIETLRPYTHVWVQPKTLRDAVKKVVDRLEALKETFHGSEVLRPVFVAEFHADSEGNMVRKKDLQPSECISIDLGATNTVVMRKKGAEAPDFLHLGAIARQYEGALVIPTLLSADTNNIGAEAGDNPVSNIKQALLEANPRGREHMERFVRILFQHLQKVTVSPGWLKIKPKSSADFIYITVPVGYRDYMNSLRNITGRVMKGNKVEFIEEPLAAAVGYQVVDQRDKVIMVIDFGGSTLNTMLLRLNLNEVHVVAKPERAQMLGGHDVDIWLSEYLAEKAGSRGTTPYSLIVAAEELKIRLSERNEAPFVWEGREVCRVTRGEFEQVLDGHEFYKTVDRTIINVLKRAEKVGLRKDRIEAILLTGGSSQIPSFKDKISHIFPELRAKNQIYDHSPLTAVALGAALYGTRDITDRHIAMAYALRYAPPEKEVTHSYSIVLEKGEQLPLEKSFKFRPARKLGVQTDMTIELFEVPENLLTRRWVSEEGIEFLKQEMKEAVDLSLSGLKPVTVKLPQEETEEVLVTFCVDLSGALTLKYGTDGASVPTGLRLQ
jgi:actin-like ATPase involved in cell morphogenesis